MDKTEKLNSVRDQTTLDLQEPIDPGAPCRGFLKGIIF